MHRTCCNAFQKFLFQKLIQGWSSFSCEVKGGQTKQARQSIIICAMSSFVPPSINRGAWGGLKWYVHVTILWTIKKQGSVISTYQFGKIILSSTLSTERSILLVVLFQAYVGSYFNWYTPEIVFGSTAVDKDP